MTAGFWGKLLLLRLNSHLQSVFIQSQQLLHSPPGSCARSAIPGPIPSHSGGDSQAGSSSLPHQLFLSSFRNTFYSGKDVPDRKTKEFEPAWPRGWFLRGLGELRPRHGAVAPSREVSSPSQRAELLQDSSCACQLCSIPRASHSPLTGFNYL